VTGPSPPGGTDRQPGGLLLLLAGPLQSWGERSAFGERDTAAWPTRSGVVGICAAALGQSREADLSPFDRFLLAVRADRPGVRTVDFQTAGAARGDVGLLSADGTSGRSVIGHRHYLADAVFVAALDVRSGADDDESAAERALLGQIALALDRPHWPLFLGRRGCPPAYPVLLATAAEPVEPLLAELPALTGRPADTAPGIVTVVRENASPGRVYTVRNDRPVTFGRRTRSYTARAIGLDAVAPPHAGPGLDGYRALLTAARVSHHGLR
jgi:CRISPR system Cascade subunit CasD